MDVGVVARWLKEAGAAVTAGDEIVEIETDKVTTVIQAEHDGILAEPRFPAGAEAPVGAVLAVVVSGADAESNGASASAPAPAEAPQVEVDGEVDVERATGAAPVGPLPRPHSLREAPGGRARATPLARRLAREAGVDLAAVGRGSGPDGRILRHDVERATAAGPRSSPPGGGGTIITPSRRHELMARRMTESKRDVPHYYVSADVDVTLMMEMRDGLAALRRPLEVSVTDVVVRACALALRDVPDVNASWADGRIVRHDQVHIGVAVALDGGELVVPVVRHADRRTLRELSAEVRSLVARARDGDLTLPDLEGGTFTVSSLGMYGIDEFHAIVNPPESGILAVGAIAPRLALDRGAVVERHVVRVSLSADHRVFSGAAAAVFVGAVRSHLESPFGLLLDHKETEAT